LYQILDNLKQLGPLSPSARLFTANAVLICTNIDTKHGLKRIQKWFDLHCWEILVKYPRFPFKLILELLRLVMTNNIFQFDNCLLHQQNGTAVGTSVACLYATIYYSDHEETHILPKYKLFLRYYTVNASTTLLASGYPLPMLTQKLPGLPSKQTSLLAY
jgi:hypothetical protein